MKIIAPLTQSRFFFMDGYKAKEALIDRYVVIATKGFPTGTIAPLKRWIAVVAMELQVSAAELQTEIRTEALHRMKVANRQQV